MINIKRTICIFTSPTNIYLAFPLANIHWIFCFTDYAKASDCVDHNKLWKVLKEMGITEHLTCLQRNLYADQQQVEPNMKQLIGSILGKEYVKAVYCHPAYLT